MNSALVLENVFKRFGPVRAVDNLSMTVPNGCIYGFLGPNGAGKTTTIRMMMSILYPDSGSLRVLGNANAEAVKDRLGYLPEERGLYKKMKTGDLLTYFGRLKGMSATTARSRAEDLLRRFDLGDWIHKKCETLSKGMGQKVQFLSTLIHDPELIILDEPFSGFDPVNVDIARKMILDLKKQGRTVIFSTHVMEQAEQLCDHIFLINRGRKVLAGETARIKAGAGKSVVIDFEGNADRLNGLPGVHRVNNAGTTAELILEPGADSQRILEQLVGRIRIHRFDTTERSLHEIFIHSVRGDAHV